MSKELESYLQNENVQAFLSMLRDAEGTSKGVDPYRVYGGSAKNQLKSLDKPAFSAWGFTQTDGKKNKSTATGAYQFLESTWKDLSKKYGFTDFSPKTQDMAAVALLKQNGALPHILSGDFSKAVQKSNRTWASLPGSPYAQKTRSMDFVQDSISKGLGSPIDLAKYQTEQNGEDSSSPQSKDIKFNTDPEELGVDLADNKDQANAPLPFQPEKIAVLNDGTQIVPESRREEEFLQRVADNPQRTDEEKARIAKMGALFAPNTYDIDFKQNRRSSLPTELDDNIRQVIRTVS